MRNVLSVLTAFAVGLFLAGAATDYVTAEDSAQHEVIRTVADASEAGGGTRGVANIRKTSAWDQGEVFYFEQPLLSATVDEGDEWINGDVIGTNAGFCIATDPENAFFECTWTLTWENGVDSITVAGQENGAGESWVAIVGGTGRFAGVTGEMHSIPNGADPNLQFRQTLFVSHAS